MAIDFSKYVYQPRPLQQWDIGEGLNDIIQGNRAREVAGRQERQFQQNRGDSQAQFSANFAKQQGDSQNTAATTRHQVQTEAVNKATMAAQKGDWNTARALLPRILELGGEATESGTPESPIFRFKAGAAPARPPLDMGGARRQIYGGGNPMDPPSLPGASAAAAGTPNPMNQGPTLAGNLTGPPPGPAAAADPPPGAARSAAPPGAVWLPPGTDPGTNGAPPPDPAAAQTDPSTGTSSSPPAPSAPPAAGAPPGGAAQQTEQPGSPQLTGPNPFDPYTIDTSAVMASNRMRLDPMLKGIADASGRYKPDVEAFNQNLHKLRLDPSATLEAAKPYFSELTGLYRGQMAAEGQSNRLDAMRANQQSIQDNKDRTDARAVANRTIENNNLKKIKDQLTASSAALSLIDQAGSNPNVANALIETLYKMRNTGVMTDKDFERSSKGAQSIWSGLKNDTLNTFFQKNGGFNPDMVRDLRELIDVGTRNSRAAMMEARNGLYRAWQNAPTESHRQVYDESIRIFFPPEYLPEEFKETWEKGGGGEEVPTHDQADEEAVMRRMQEEENLGVTPLPNMRSEPGRAGAVRGSRVPAKPPRKPKEKDVKDMTDDEVRAEMKKVLEQ